MVRVRRNKDHADDCDVGRPDGDAFRLAAIEYAKRGFRIVPCHSVRDGKCTCGKCCRKPGKHPRPPKWPDVASCDTSTVAEWWSKWPMANVGVATGAGSGILVFDFDGEDGAQTLRELAAEDATIMNTLIHQTGSGGTHLFYRHPGGSIGNAIETLTGMDIRADRGLIILPPSRHSSGNDYRVNCDRPVAVLPPSLQRFLSPCHKEKQRELKRVDEGQRESKQEREKKGGSKKNLPPITKDLLERTIQASLPTGPGRRNRQVFELSRHLLTIDGITQDISATLFRPIVGRWHNMAVEQATRLGFVINGDLEETWTDFRYGWGKVTHPFGCALKPVFDEIHQMDVEGEVEPPVWNALEYFRRTADLPMRLLHSVLFELAHRASDEPFSLACNIGAQHLRRIGAGEKISETWVYRRLKTLEDDGILHCVDKGQSGGMCDRRAAKYRWIWTEKDPPDDPFA